MKTVVVIGGGITGLSTVYYLEKALRERQKSARLVLIEATDALGGKIRTVHEGEFAMETGADSIVARKTNVAPLIEELGLQEEVAYNATGISYIYSDGQLKPIPRDALFGIPLSIESLATSELVSADGKVEALKDLYTPNTTFTREDSIGAFLTHFLGQELVEKQIAPVLSGVYSGDLNELTLASTLPYLLDYKNEHGSLIRGLEANRERLQRGGDRKFLSFRGGMSALVDRMEERLQQTDIYKGVAAERLERTEKDGSVRYQLSLSNGEELEADVVVLSTLHPVTDRLLHDERLHDEFAQMRNNSLISVYLGFDIPDEQLPKDGTGFINADEGDLVCNACTWSSRKWSHTSKHQRLLVRMFYKSSGKQYDRLLKLSDEELQQVALQDMRLSLGIDSTPVSCEVTKWHETMPNYHLKHPQLVRSLESQLAERYPNVLLAGCSYYGVGIPDCILNGERTAAKIAEAL
ncbi:oxygen-dependent protoporphyrinogen oxidase [Paenibacillus phyllosphaerae]|uniref:Coproporphyrinogen III oxidase n=1 Tax=Paenibacillus phyllosphaerae TaxID=274593 RepID=A0A7W5AWC4_9BACL|nr:protoporphyrinogen oxidase [Paenibacillus phyllosphaerae]MBB3110029.1 oxygen-dependent protoporphyrinogen oxidase [Paenibacillus phyllosphaerae]